MEDNQSSLINKLAPLTEFNNSCTISTTVDYLLRPLSNKKGECSNPLRNVLLQAGIKALSKEVLSKTFNVIKQSVRRCFVHGNPKSLWNAVCMAKDINAN